MPNDEPRKHPDVRYPSATARRAERRWHRWLHAIAATWRGKRIFIAYRKDDAMGIPGRLADDLVALFGRERVYRDVSTLQGGENFLRRLHTVLADADVVLVLVGKRWLDASAAGSRRLDDPEDVHRGEIAAALTSGCRVIPVLLDGATPLAAAVLPPDIAELAALHAMELSDTRWDYDVSRLAQAIDPHRARRRFMAVGLGAAVVGGAAAAGVWVWRGTPLAKVPGNAGWPPPDSNAATARHEESGGLSLWANGSTLRMRFMDGTGDQRELARRAAKEWSRYANVHFSEVDAGFAEVRIAFKPNGGSWAYIGPAALGVAAAEATMNLGLLEFGAVLHEFGHVLGLIHENQNPGARLPWNRKMVYSQFTRDDADRQIMAPEKVSDYRPYDADSVMMHAFDASFFTDHRARGGAQQLSDSDKAFIAKLYPK